MNVCKLFVFKNLPSLEPISHCKKLRRIYGNYLHIEQRSECKASKTKAITIATIISESLF